MAQGDDGVEGCGGDPGPAMGPGCLGWPPPPKPGHPPPRRPEGSGLDSPVFVAAGAPPVVGGGGGYGWTRGGGVHLDKPLRLGVVNRWWGWQPELPGPGKRWGEVRPPAPRKRGEVVRVGANQSLHPREEKGGGHPLAIGRQLLAGVGLGGDGVCGEGVDLDADLVGADGHGGFQPGGGEPGGVCRGGAQHRLPAQVQAQARRNPR